MTALLYIKAICRNHCKKNASDGIPKVQAIPNSYLLHNNKRISDLYQIAIALEKYKSDHNAYPISSNNGKDWNSRIKGDGSSDNIWLKDLYPDYMNHIPIDSRMSSHPAEQYAYMSDGANYKLIVGYPTDCISVKKLHPELIPSLGECVAYGFWTSDIAIRW